ncbi:MAG: hypothetical protein M3328_11265 [Chloroflexota bacterium]|nr:hypothetical protein [Chloroflexota bacterium]
MAETSPPDDELLSLAASRAANRAHLFASVLARYAGFNNLDDENMRAELGCDARTLTRLRLCLRPDPDPAAFTLDVQRIAESLGLNATVLARIVREVDATDAFAASSRQAPFSSTPGGMLKAARDHDEVESAREPSVESRPGEEGEQ